MRVRFHVPVCIPTLGVEGVIAPADPLAKHILLSRLDLYAIRVVLELVLEKMISNHVWDRIDGLNENFALKDVMVTAILDDVFVPQFKVATIGVSLEKACPKHNYVFVWDELNGIPLFESYIPGVPTSQRDEALEEVYLEASSDGLVCDSPVEEDSAFLLNLVFN